MCEVETAIKTSEMELEYAYSVLKQRENETLMNDAAYIKDREVQTFIENEIKKLKHELECAYYEDGVFEQLQEHKKCLLQEIRNLQQKLDLKNTYRYELQYQNPEPNFDRTKVKGMVGKLFKVRDEKNSLALVMTAGNNLYSHVTDDDITSKKILQHGRLQQRVTIIPLNKIFPRSIDHSIIDIAKKLVGKENVQSAISLIDYEGYFQPVMEFVFGSTLVCRDLNISKQITYHRNVHCRSVTLEGDVVDPEGTLSGGSIPKGGNILQDLAEINNFENIISARRNELNQVEQKLNSLQDVMRTYKECKGRLELREHELNMCKQRLAQTTFHKYQEEVKTLQTRIQSLESDLFKARWLEKSYSSKVKDIEEKLYDSKNFRDRELKSASEEMKAAKKKAEASRNLWKKHDQEYETLQLEISELRKGIQSATTQRECLITNLIKIKTDLEALRNNNVNIVQQISELKIIIKSQKDKINSQNKDLKNLFLKREELQKQSQEITLEIKKKDNEINKVRNDGKDYFKKIKDLEDKYNWIKEDCDFFGIKNTRYDYSKEDPFEAGQKLASMRDQRDKMERSINLRAMMLLDREEEQYQETIRRKKIVEQDKEKIKHIICRMDEKKREKVEKAWKVVDQNFSSIFSTLLQGAQARLCPVKKGNLLTGLEIKIGFNGVWKESLGELSGGQRSLVALSLVLAMLKFCPAPLYILDEVDAALDMSHTQNIGNMLKMHFTSSQFIIVSLKDGMFNNANVLFRTKFEEGVSVITRTVNAKMPAGRTK